MHNMVLPKNTTVTVKLEVTSIVYFRESHVWEEPLQ